MRNKKKGARGRPSAHAGRENYTRQLAGTCLFSPAVRAQTHVIGDSAVAWVGVRVNAGATVAPVAWVVTAITPFAAIVIEAT